MKLRIHGAHLRIRTDPAEMRALAALGCIEDRVPLTAERALVYRLIVAGDVQTLGVAFEDNVIEVRLPETAARRWCETDLIDLTGTQRSGPVELRVTLEKDFDPRD
ncbi:MAG: DUF7009 family protein [Steroidobacteraceae bacterium]